MLIGSGSYGCVYRPAIKCIDGKTRPGVSKIQLYKDSISENKKNQSILGYSNHRCRPDLSDIVLDESCPKGDLGMIIYPDYGMSLSEFISSRDEIRLIVKGLSNIFLGIETMNSEGKYHRDIHINNILVDETDTFRIIDYGLAVNLRLDDNPYVDELPASWPPEALLLVEGDTDSHYSKAITDPILLDMADADIDELHRGIDVFGFGEVLEIIIKRIPALRTSKLKKLISDMTELHPHKRIDISKARARFNEIMILY
jgi:serine/threonine protein kinase